MPGKPLLEKPAVGAPVSPPKGKGPTKGKGPPRPRPIRGKLRLKTEAPATLKEGAKPRKRAMGRAEPDTDQVSLKVRAPAAEGFVRFRVSVDDGKMSIVDSQLVGSALVRPSVIHGNFVYEVTERERRLHLDSIPDLGVIRSFPNPEGPLEQQRHHTYELSTYEFRVRVPANELAKAALRDVTIILYRVKEPRPLMTVGVAPLSVQFERELREVARLEGIPPKVLPKPLQRRGASAPRARTRKPK